MECAQYLRLRRSGHPAAPSAAAFQLAALLALGLVEFFAPSAVVIQFFVVEQPQQLVVVLQLVPPPQFVEFQQLVVVVLLAAGVFVVLAVVSLIGWGGTASAKVPLRVSDQTLSDRRSNR